ATTATPYLHFDLAYTQYFSATDPTPAPDQIDIFASSDCGTTWTNVYSKNQIQLQTVLPAIQDNPTTTTQNETNDWKPTVDSDWRHEIVNLSTVANQSSVLIKIKNTSGYGTRVLFDNIKINSNAVLNTEENSFDTVSIYPNPSKDIFNISLPFSNEEYSITIYNILGQLVLKDSFSGSNTNQNTINLSGKEKGIYYVKVESKSKKIIIKKIIKI
ncbi:T9SS type A sorting domain-containing protein, partial [Flavobacterium psychrophilum]|nr:T9SS type A sorting domain-containing protein [Flavobacterium psychrophilum]